MDYSARLTAAEVECLSDPDATFEDTMEKFDNFRKDEEWVFQRCLRIWNVVEVLEGKGEGWSVLAVLLHCEFLLWHEYAREGNARYNPFRSHWVDALQRLDTVDTKKAWTAAKGQGAKMQPTAEAIAAARVEWIKKIVTCTEWTMSAVIAMTPREVLEAARTSTEKPFAIEPYIQVLINDGILDKSDVPSTSRAPSASTPHLDNGRPKGEPSSSATHYAHSDWKETLLANLSKDPSTAVHDLTRLPLQLPHLDFLTHLLTSRTLESHAIEPLPVILSYIQHSLRTIERMEAPPPPSSHPSPANNGDEGQEEAIWEYGKEAQARSVKLLLLFIKSLIRKGLVGAEGLYFEIQEICYRYVWIGEVRGFRKWVEEGGEEGEVG